jgi:FMN phosphatase YigB (HAD superfamily)
MKPILFIDFDGTICHDRFWRGLDPKEYLKVQEFLFGDDLSYVNEWMRGGKTSEEVNALLAEQTGIPYEKLWNTFVQDCRTMRVSSEILEKIQFLRSTYTIILITGNMDCFMRFTVPALNLGPHFDAISSSYDEKMSKTDNNGEVFKKYADRYGVALENCLVIDDSEAVCKVFESHGGMGHLVSKGKDVMFFLEKIASI